MNHRTSRRQFLVESSAVASAIGMSSLTACSSKASNATRTISSDQLVKLEPDVEPLVRLIETTPREKCIETVSQKIRSGTDYRTLMAALFLAGIRNIESISTGGPLHAVFVMHSAHQMSLDSAPEEQFLPMFWSLDNFKATQERGSRLEKMTEFTGKPIEASKAVSEFNAAMEAYDPDRAEAAMVGMLRSVGNSTLVEQLWKWGARDYRAIGHKAIYAANTCRTLDTIGWRHAEPAMRHLARALNAYGTQSSVSGYDMDQQCYSGNLRRAAKHAQLPADWIGTKDSPTVVRELLAAIRTGNFEDVCDLVFQYLKSGLAKSSTIWDAVHLAAGEIVMRQASIRPIHAVTSANAIHYAFNRSGSTETRLYLLLQASGWLCQFINFIKTGRRDFPDRRIDELQPIEGGTDKSVQERVPEIFDKMSSEPDVAAQLAYSMSAGSDNSTVAPEFLKLARSLIYRKGTESHRYKFPAAALEDIKLMAPRWRPHFLAATTHYLCGSQLPDSPIMQRAREALKE